MWRDWQANLRRRLFEPLFYARNGSPRLSYWKEVEKTQYFSREALEELQWERLGKLLEFVYDKNPYYRQLLKSHGLTPQMIRSPEDMRKLPILTKRDVRQNSDLMLSDGYDKSRLHQFKTGGSTGKSLELYITDECSEKRNAVARRHDRWSGWEPCDPIGALWGNPHRPQTLKEKIIDRLVQPTIFLDTMELTDDSVRRFVREWERVGPSLLFGHAHSIYMFAVYLKKLGVGHLKPRGILSTSMMLLPSERAVIEEVFDQKVFDRYGCEEVSLIGAECEQHQGMHLNIEHLFVEFLKEDGSPASAGEPGRIIVTDLMNYAMPFVRYQVEDVGVPSDRTCACGRGLPLMEEVVGRVADFLIKKDGTRVAGISLIENTLTAIQGITQMQIVQESMERIRLRIVEEKDIPESSVLELKTYFEKIFAGITIEIEKVREIKPEASGKYRFSICKIH